MDSQKEGAGGVSFRLASQPHRGSFRCSVGHGLKPLPTGFDEKPFSLSLRGASKSQFLPTIPAISFANYYDSVTIISFERVGDYR